MSIVPQGPITSFSGTYAALSNFHPVRVKLDGIEYPSVEHAYQAAKTLHPSGRELFNINPVTGAAISAGDAKRYGRALDLRADWEQVKLNIMKSLLEQKFSWRHKDLRSLLVSTADVQLVEGNYWHDNFWGRCYCDRCPGQGYNWLGKLLMIQRKQLNWQDRLDAAKEATYYRLHPKPWIDKSHGARKLYDAVCELWNLPHRAQESV